MAAQWLNLCASIVESMGLIPGQELSIYNCVVWPKKKENYPPPQKKQTTHKIRDFLGVSMHIISKFLQRLKFHTSIVGGMGLIPGWGLLRWL